MDNDFHVKPIGVIRADGDGFRVALRPAYREALAGLEGFAYVQILWWFSGCDNRADRQVFTEPRPYAGGPETLGTFATRSPRRPNPIALTSAQVIDIDRVNGTIGLAYIDADDQSPVLDLKPYTPSLDRVERPAVPEWCAHWPRSVETSGDFDWGSVFSF